MDKSGDPIIEKTKELMELVRRSRPYQDYKSSLEAVRASGALYDKLNLFRRRNIEADFIEDPEERSKAIDMIYHEFEDVLIDPVSVRFLSCEQKVCRTLQKIYETIADSVDLDLSQFD